MIDQPSSRMVFRLDILCRSLFYVFLFFASLVTVHYSIGGIRLNPSEMVGVVFGLVVLFHLVFLGKVRVEHKRLVVIPIVLYFFVS